LRGTGRRTTWTCSGLGPIRGAWGRLCAGGWRALDVLQLALQVLDRLVELGDARLQFVNGVIERLNLSGGGIDFAAQAVALLVDLLLQSVHRLAHLVGIVSGLFDEVLQDPEPCVEGGLKALHHVEQLLHLGLQGDDFL
jgi:hypothetical protein